MAKFLCDSRQQHIRRIQKHDQQSSSEHISTKLRATYEISWGFSVQKTLIWEVVKTHNTQLSVWYPKGPCNPSRLVTLVSFIFIREGTQGNNFPSSLPNGLDCLLSIPNFALSIASIISSLETYSAPVMWNKRQRIETTNI